MFKNSQRPPFYIFRHYATYRRPKSFREKFSKIISKKVRIFFQFFPHAGTVEGNTLHIEVLLLFLSFRYGADLGRSRLVICCFDKVFKYSGIKLNSFINMQLFRRIFSIGADFILVLLKSRGHSPFLFYE